MILLGLFQLRIFYDSTSARSHGILTSITRNTNCVMCFSNMEQKGWSFTRREDIRPTWDINLAWPRPARGWIFRHFIQCLPVQELFTLPSSFLNPNPPWIMLGLDQTWGNRLKKWEKPLHKQFRGSTIPRFLINTSHIQCQGSKCRISALSWRDHRVSILTIDLEDLPASAV